MRYQVDSGGVENIASFEGFVNGVYADSRGFATCGYGHLLHESTPTAEDHAEYDGRGEAFYLRLLHEDIERVALEPMRRVLRRKLNQNEVNAVASACFNCGGGFVEGTVGRDINAGRMQAAADAFLLWAHPSELLPRRESERALFLRPVERKVRFPWLQPAERRVVEEYDRLLARKERVARRRTLRVVMLGMRKRIAYAAVHEGGWELAHRRQRYQTLLVRTR